MDRKYLDEAQRPKVDWRSPGAVGWEKRVTKFLFWVRKSFGSRPWKQLHNVVNIIDATELYT